MTDTIPPVPKPRVSPLEQKHSEYKMPRYSSKKPVPLPRLKISDEPNCSPRETNNEDSLVSERQTCSITSHVSENSDRMQCNKRIPSQNVKEEWKIECDDVQLKGKSVIGRKKNVSTSIEKSFRNMISKRLTVRTTAPIKVNEFSVMRIGRSQSLPSEDIFKTIYFQSPLTVENVPQELVACEDTVDEDCISKSGAPPPVYPPPPLPDESVYDEVHSVVSSHSSGYEPYCDSNIAECETLYEDISSFRENSGNKPPVASQMATQENVPESSQSSVDSQHIFSLRSDSWSFYDSAPEDIYQNAAPSDILSLSSSSVIYNRHCSSKLSSTESTPSSVQEDPNCDDNAEISEGEQCANCSIQVGRQQSVNIQNELYENWETGVPVRNAKERHKVLTKSVILEFDPLYENSDGSGKSNDSYTEFLLLAGTNETDSPYGKINRAVRSEALENETGEKGEFACPPVPPRRYDSITVIHNEESSSTVEHKSEGPSEVPLANSDVNSKGSSLEKAESGFMGDSNSDANVDSLLARNRKAALVRWASMKRAIQMMAEGSSFRKIAKEQVGMETKPDNQNAVFYGGQGKAHALVKRPNLTSHAVIRHSGMLYRSASGCRDFMPRHCVLAEGKLSCFSDKSDTSIIEVIPLDKFLSIHFVPEQKAG
jgi:hypothetical protein